MSMEDSGRRDIDTQTFRATRQGPDGRQDSIGLVFQGQRLDDLKNGALLSEMEQERKARSAKGDYSAPSRNVRLTGAWKPRSWKDRDGSTRKAFDLVVATWTLETRAGEKVTEGAAPGVPSITHQEEQKAILREKAQDKASSRWPRKDRDGPAL